MCTAVRALALSQHFAVDDTDDDEGVGCAQAYLLAGLSLYHTAMKKMLLQVKAQTYLFLNATRLAAERSNTVTLQVAPSMA